MREANSITWDGIIMGGYLSNRHGNTMFKTDAVMLCFLHPHLVFKETSISRAVVVWLGSFILLCILYISEVYSLHSGV